MTPFAELDARARWGRAMRIALPLLALALLSSVFLVAPRPAEDVPAIPFARAEAVSREQRLGRPDFAGVTADGTRLTLSADSARPVPGAPGAIAASTVRVRAEMPARAIDLTAPEGEVLAGRIAVSGGVDVTTSDGWHVTAPRMEALLDETVLTAAGPVDGRGPLGRIEAGAMRATRETLDFTGGARVIYEPSTTEDP